MGWQRVKDSLREVLAENIYGLWIEPIELRQVKADCLYLATPDRYFSAYIRQNFMSLIEQKMSENGLASLKVVLCENCEPVAVGSESGRSGGIQMRLPHIPENNSRCRSLHPRYTFEEFMVGESNILAESACRSMATRDNIVGPCLYINSDTGLGKSHLTHALAHHLLSESPMTRLQYLTAKQFAAEMVQGIQTNTMELFKRKYQEQCDILLVEDIHTLTGKKKTQEELNEVLDALIKSGRRVVLTSKRAPRDLEGIDSEFRSRMTSGLVTSIKAPDISTRQRIVQKKAAQHQLLLDDRHVSFLAQNIRGDIRKIESALVGIRAKAQLLGGHVDMDLIRQVISTVIGIEQSLTAEMICELVSVQFKVSVADLKSKSRKKAITFPRQIAMYLARRHTEESLVDIGRLFNRDHSTVLHAIKVVGDKAIRDTSVNAQIELLADKLRQL